MPYEVKIALGSVLQTKKVFSYFQLAPDYIVDNPWGSEFEQSNCRCLSHSGRDLLRCGLWLRYSLFPKSLKVRGMEVEEREDGVLQCVAKLQRFYAHEWNGTRLVAEELVTISEFGIPLESMF